MQSILLNLKDEFLNSDILIANIIGIVSLTFICLSYQCASKKKYLIFQICANIFYSIQYFFLCALSAAYMSILQIIKAILFYLIENNKLKISKNILLWIFVVLSIIIGFITYESPISLIPIVINILYTFAMWVTNLTTTYSISTICPIGWLLYNLIFKAYVAAFGSIFEFIFALIGLFKEIFRKQFKNK